MASDQETLKIPRSSRPLVGFAPSIVANHRQIHGAIRKLGFSILVDSFWECRSRSMTAGQKETNMFIDCRQLMGSGQRQFRRTWQICGGSFLKRLP
jgi:hypothetical protein